MRASLEFRRATPLGSMHSVPSSSWMDRLLPGAKAISAASNLICYIAYVPSCLVYDSILSSRICSGIPRRPLLMKNGQRTFLRRLLGSPLKRSGILFLLLRATFLTKTRITMGDLGAVIGRVMVQSEAPKDREFGG